MYPGCVDAGGSNAVSLEVMRRTRLLTNSVPRRSRWFSAFLLTLAAALAQPALAQTGSAAAPTPLRVVVTINPYADLTQRIAAGHAQVTTLLPPGASPHDFDPSPSQAADLANADLVIMNGGVDGWLLRLVTASAPKVSVLVVMDEIDFAAVAQEHDHDDEAHSQEAADSEASSAWANPHIWLDPLLAEKAVTVIAAKLVELDPANAEEYRTNAQQVRAELLAVHEELSTTLAPLRGAAFVPFHDAWVYFADRYGLDLVVTLEPFPGREPSALYVATAVQLVKQSGARALFSERQLPTRLAEVVAESAGVPLAMLDPIGGAPGPVGYEELLRYNAALILAALAP